MKTLLIVESPSKVKTIEKLLSKHGAYFVLLYPVTSEINGHWACMTRYDKTIEFFDSYGIKIDDELKFSYYN